MIVYTMDSMVLEFTLWIGYTTGGMGLEIDTMWIIYTRESTV